MMHWQCGHGKSVDWVAVMKNLLQALVSLRQFTRRPVDRIFELISAGFTGPHVSHAVIGEMLSPFRFDQGRTPLRALINRFHRMLSFQRLTALAGETAPVLGRNSRVLQR